MVLPIERQCYESTYTRQDTVIMCCGKYFFVVEGYGTVTAFLVSHETINIDKEMIRDYIYDKASLKVSYLSLEDITSLLDFTGSLLIGQQL